MIDGIGSTLSFRRADDGSVIIVADNAECAEIKGVGTISGSGEISFGVTDQDSDITVFEYSHDGDSDNEFVLANVNENYYNIKGENANVSSASGGAKRVIQIEGESITLDLSDAGGNQHVYATANSTQNHVTLGCGNDVYIDEGKFNEVNGNRGSNVLQSTEKSFGSIMIGGSGSDTFDIAGSYGIYDGGNGSDTFNLSGAFGANKDASYRNLVIGGAGNDTFNDNGGYNMFFGGSGTDNYIGNGSNGIAYLGEDENGSATFGSAADKSYVFSTLELRDSSGKTYKLKDVMAKYGWTLNDFLFKYSQISSLDKRSLATSGMISNTLKNQLESYFNEKLEKELA